MIVECRQDTNRLMSFVFVFGVDFRREMRVR